MIHIVKTLPEYFEASLRGDKLFECRKNDRDYKVEDVFISREWDKTKGYSGRVSLWRITYVLSRPDYVKDCFVNLGIKPLYGALGENVDEWKVGAEE